MDRGYYETHSITVARHPSETDERMMMRILAFIVHASDQLVFAEGLSSPDEPDLWEKDLTGAVGLWVMVGLPDEKQIKKAASRSKHVTIFSYGASAIDQWWSIIAQRKLTNVSVVNISQTESNALTTLVERVI